MSDERKNQLDRVGVIHLWNTIKAALDDKVDKIEGMGLSSNDFTTEEKKKLETLSDPALATSESDGLMSAADKIKLDTIEKGANNYAHPTYQEKEAGVYRISVDKLGHVASAEKMTDEELTAEGISPADHTHDLGKLADELEVTTGAADDADIMIVGHDETDDSGVANRKYYRRTLSSVWDWIKSKADEVFAAKEHSHKIEDLTEYDSRIYDATVARTQRTVLAAPTDQDGVASFRALDKNDVGLEDVDNTADADKNVKSAILATNADNVLQTVVDTEADTNWRPLVFGSTSNEDETLTLENETGPLYVANTIAVNPSSGVVKATKFQGNLDGKASSAESTDYAKETLFGRATRVSLTSLDESKQYPVVSSIPSSGFHRIKCNVQLDGWSKPSWSTHSSGFTVNLDLLIIAGGWGTTGAQSICLNNYYNQTSSGATPAGYSQMTNSSKAVFWLRGGGSYCLYADWEANWSLKTESFTDCGQTVSPTSSYPGVSFSKSTIIANLDGSASNGISASGSGYTRFGNGMQLCWGITDCKSTSTDAWFAQSFKDANYAVEITGTYGAVAETYWTIGNCQSNYITIKASKAAIATRNIRWIAIGWQK